MRTEGISTFAFSSVLKSQVTDLQAKLLDAQTELSTGRHADPGLALGWRTSWTISMRGTLDELSSRTVRLQLASDRADVSQKALDQFREQIGQFVSALTGARGAENGRALARNAAASALESVTSLMNAAYNGNFVFGGLNAAAPPMPQYAGSDAKLAVDQLIQSELGTSQDGPAMAAVTPEMMTSFLEGPFASQFETANWQALWTKASDEVPGVRVSENQSVTAGASANTPAFRKAMEGITMMLELSRGELSQDAFDALTGRAVKLLSEARLEAGHVQAEIGLGEAAIATAAKADMATKELLGKSIANAESVDPYEVSARINQLMTQLEASYTITGKLRQLSLVNFI